MDHRIDKRRRSESLLRLVLLLGLITLVWAAAVRLVGGMGRIEKIQQVDMGGLMTVLFGASSIALFMLSLLAAVLAIFGWQALKEHIKKSVEDASKDHVEQLGNELRGRILTNLGYVVGEMCIDKETLRIKEPAERDRLDSAIHLCQDALILLQKAGDKFEFLGLNNLVYFTCVYGDKSREKYLLEQARRLRDKAQEHDSVNLQLTACRVFLEFSAKPHEKKAAQQVLEAFVNRKEKITAREKREAAIYLTWANKLAQGDDHV